MRSPRSTASSSTTRWRSRSIAARDPDALERVDPEALRDLAGDDAIDDLDQLAALTRALEEAGYLDRDGGHLELTPRAARKLGMRALTDIFSRLRREGFGGHPLPQAGRGGEPTEETKPYEFGDAFAVDINRTLFNAMARSGPGTPVRIGPADFEVSRTEETTLSSTVLLLDMSRSMLLRGCSSAAKQVAMALHTLIHTKYPRDRLFVVGFAYYARQLSPESIPTLSPYEFEYGTNLQHALIIARQLLGRSTGGNKEIVVITDGEPTAHIDNGQVEFAYPPTLRTVQSTLREVGRCTREGIVINTFMLERSRYLSEFVDLMIADQPRAGLLRRARAPRRVRPRRLRQQEDEARGVRSLSFGERFPSRSLPRLKFPVARAMSCCAAARVGAGHARHEARRGAAPQDRHRRGVIADDDRSVGARHVAERLAGRAGRAPPCRTRYARHKPCQNRG